VSQGLPGVSLSWPANEDQRRDHSKLGISIQTVKQVMQQLLLMRSTSRVSAVQAVMRQGLPEDRALSGSLISPSKV